MSSKREYEVGYGRPPKAHQFKPNQSGNRKGRPKGARGLKTEVCAILNMRVTVNSKSGKKQSVTTLHAALLRLREMALGGDLRALREVIALGVQYLPEQVDAFAQDSVSEVDRQILASYLERHSPAADPDGIPQSPEDDHGND